MFVLKRLVNALLTIPFLVLGCVLLIGVAASIGHWMDVFEQSNTEVFTGSAVLFASALAFLAAFGSAVVLGTFIPIALVTGDGLLWRRVYKNDLLQDKSEKTVHTFDKDSLIWRFDPIFRKRKLLCCDMF